MENQMEPEIETAGCVRILSSLMFRPCSQGKKEWTGKCKQNVTYQINIIQSWEFFLDPHYQFRVWGLDLGLEG